MLVTVVLVCLLVGVNGNRIAGGNVPEEQKYPFAASLITNNGLGTSYSHACGGSILTNNAILSAASCFYTGLEAHPASWWRLRVGSSLSNAGGTVYVINRITPHTDFLPATGANDIAILRTTLNMVLVPGSVEVARISGAAYTFGINQQVMAIGWGAISNQDTSASSPELREVQIWTIDQTTCTNRWNELGFTVTANMVCVGWLDVGVRGQCPVKGIERGTNILETTGLILSISKGDNGSPLLDINGGFIVGVFSRSNGCAVGWYPDVNTRVQPYISWIISNV